MSKPQEQVYGSDPLKVRTTDHYKYEYVDSFAQKWDQLIDWEGRAAGEGRFFIDILKEHGVRTVLDVATGTGFHSVQLLKAGFQVYSVDGSAEMLAQAFENGRQYDLILRTIQADWRWLNRDVHGKYDAVLCLGNSFTHLFSDADRRRCLAEFYAALKHDGILILDQRNYEALLNNQKTNPDQTYYYCGKEVSAQPEYVDDSLARFRYEFPDGQVFHLNMFPLRKKYVQDLMKEVGFQRVKTYGDFKEDYDYEDEAPDFFIHVADKLYKTEDES